MSWRAEEPGTRPSSPESATPGRSPGAYPPSWVDRLQGWVHARSLPSWAVYTILGLALTVFLLLPTWIAETGTVVRAAPYYLLEGMTLAYLLGLMHYLDEAASAALARFRPVLTLDEAGYDALHYRLTTMPARRAWIATALGAAYTVVALVANILTGATAAIEGSSAIVIVVAVGFNFLIYALVGVLVYHTVHQLSLVNRIYTRYTRIDLFQFGPLYAFSHLTARTAIGIAIPTYLWFQVNALSETGTAASDVIQTIVLGIMILVTFIWPLMGAHSLLEQEKQRLQNDVGRRIEGTIARVSERVDAGALEENGALKETLDLLVTTQSVINRLPTWPWRTETISSLGLTFFLPLLIWIVQRVLERFGL